jgi:adenosylcobinamide kinase/adenosylcobinamide-phosphate guanylyltransferase
MASRITQHRSSRPAHWQTVEAPVDLAAAISTPERDDPPACVLVDCLTLWLGNVIEAAGDPDKHGFAARARAEFEPAAGALAAALNAARQPVVLVTNEVGSGVAPPTVLGNVFADLQGELNQAGAAISTAVYHVIAGISVKIK